MQFSLMKFLGAGLLLAPMLALSGNTAPTPAASAASQNQGFNKSEIQALYFDGEFEPLSALLENLRQQRRLRDREDSIFIFKYLGVIYGADEATRKKAESFLYAMLKLDPNANLTELSVGTSVENLFQKVRLRYQQTYHDTTFDKQKQIILRQWAADSARRDSLRQAKAAPKPAVAGSSTAADENRRTWIWVAAGGAAAALVTTGIIFALSGSPGKQVDSIVTVIK